MSFFSNVKSDANFYHTREGKSESLSQCHSSDEIIIRWNSTLSCKHSPSGIHIFISYPAKRVSLYHTMTDGLHDSSRVLVLLHTCRALLGLQGATCT